MIEHVTTPLIQARVSPEGFVAQRFDVEFEGNGSWILTAYRPNPLMGNPANGLQMQAFSDEDVADWVELVPKQN